MCCYLHCLNNIALYDLQLDKRQRYYGDDASTEDILAAVRMCKGKRPAASAGAGGVGDSSVNGHSDTRVSASRGDSGADTRALLNGSSTPPDTDDDDAADGAATGALEAGMPSAAQPNGHSGVSVPASEVGVSTMSASAPSAAQPNGSGADVGSLPSSMQRLSLNAISLSTSALAQSTEPSTVAPITGNAAASPTVGTGAVG
jgi:hypothetical protein